MSETFTNLERAVLEKMLADENSELKILRDQFSRAIVSTRETTQSGFFTSFEIPADVPRLQRKGRVTINDISANLPDLRNGAGFVLFVDEGAMSCLEGFCYDESWPNSTKNFELSYLRELPRGSGKLIPAKERDMEFALKDFVS